MNAFSSYGDRVGRSPRMPDGDFRRLLEEARLVPVSSVFAGSVKLTRAGREWKACCPFHPDRTPSLTINDEKGFYHCFGCGAHGDGPDAYQALYGVGLMDAVAALTSGALPVRAAKRWSTTVLHEGETVEQARSIWRNAVSAVETPVQVYLQLRGLTLDIPESIRFARLRYGGRGDAMPCLVAAVTSPDDRLCGIQRTFLREDGQGKADVPEPKLSLGRIRGGAIRLAPVAVELAVAEGLEDSLTVMQELGLPTWAAAGASMLPSMELPAAVRSVVIAADADEAGERQARKAAEAFSLQGRSVRIIRPRPPHKDFNEQLQKLHGEVA